MSIVRITGEVQPILFHFFSTSSTRDVLLNLFIYHEKNREKPYDAIDDIHRGVNGLT
jgi:hypothetical protein